MRWLYVNRDAARRADEHDLEFVGRRLSMEHTHEMKPDAQPGLADAGKVMHPSEHEAMTGAQADRGQSALLGAWYFIRHFVEMCLAMCIGGIPLIILFFWGAAQFGRPDLLQTSPEFSVLAVACILSLPMVAWMRIRGMTWRLTAEMSGATIAVGILIVGLGWLGVLSRTSLFEWMKGLACPSMLVPMLLRLEHYTGRMDHSMHAAHHMGN